MIEPEIVLNEYQILTAAAGAVNVSDRTKIELRGDDRASFLHNFCTNDIKRLKVGEGCEAFICNVKGHVLGHVNVYCEESSLWIDTVPGQAATLLSHLDRYLIREKVELLDRTDDIAQYTVLGPQASDSLQQVTDTIGKPHSHTAFQWRNSVVVRRLDFGGSDAFAVLFEQSPAAPTHVFDLPLCSSEVLEILRIEAGLPSFGTDITAGNLPQEVDRTAQAINFTKGCYLGQETVARIDALGHVNRTLCGIAFEGTSIPALGDELYASDATTAGMADGEKSTGKLASVCWSPRLARPIALGYVRRGANSIGTRLHSNEAVGVVTSLPFPLPSLSDGHDYR